MIIYQGIFEKLTAAGYSATRLQKEKLIPASTQDRIRHNKPITTGTLDTICTLCHCQPGDLLTYEKDPEP